MTSAELKRAIQASCPEIAAKVCEEFFGKMEEEYFTTFASEAIAAHLRMAATLSGDHPVDLRIAPTPEGEFEIVIVGFDYLAQFSIFCGLLSAFALDIRSGDIYSYSDRSPAAKVVDVFRVAVKPGELFDEARQQEFKTELDRFARLLAADSLVEARARLYRFLTERIERMNEPLSGLLSAVALTFDNQTSPTWTIMEVQSEDTFAFLYAVSNALSLRGVYISRVKIRSARNQTRDRFFIADRWGNKITEVREQERLKLAVRMIKQFTRYISEAPDPAKAMHHFDQFLDRLVEYGEDNIPLRSLSLLARSDGMSRLALLLGSSDFLWDDFLQTHFSAMIPMIAKDTLPRDKSAMQRDLRAALGRTSAEQQKAVLNAFKDRQLFMIDVRHLFHPNVTMFEFSRSLTELAEVVVDEAARIAHASLATRFPELARRYKASIPFAIFGLGKFGGREMGYASDLELLFVHDGDSEFFSALAHQIAGLIESRAKGIFQIDLRLRPYGDAGPWSTPLEQFRKYYSIDGDAAPFERQALVKLRFCAGDRSLGRTVEMHRDSFTYGGQPWDWEDAMHLRKRQMAELVEPGAVNVKYSAGGIIDIEYAVQYLQLLNGREHAEIRVPTTLEALEQLRRLQIVRETDYRLLHSSYLFLRKVIDALRIVRGDSSDLVLPGESSDEFKSLARRLEYRERDRAKGAARLAADIRESMNHAHSYFMTRFGQP